MHSAGIRGISNCCSGQGRASAKPFVRLPGQHRQVQTGPVDREVHSTALPLQELASAATTLGFLGDTPTEVFASAGLLLTAAGILVVEAVQSNAFANPVSETASASDAPVPAVSKPQASPLPSTPSEPDNVVQARKWIMAWRARQAALKQPDVESFALDDTAVAESLQATSSTQESDAEARQEEVEAWIAAFRARTEAEASQPLVSPDVTPVEVKPVPTSADDKASPSNPVAAFFSWIRALWTAIINLFKQDSGSKPQTA